MSKVFSVLGAFIICGLAVQSEAGFIPTTLYNNDGGVADISHALDFNVVQDPNDSAIAIFTFQWNSDLLTQAQIDGKIRIREIAIVDGIFVDPPSDDSNLGTFGNVDFNQSTDPNGGGELFQHFLMKDMTFQLQEKSQTGSSNSTLDPGDILTVSLRLKSGFDFDDVLAGITNGTIRVGVHVISNAGQSQVYISDTGPDDEPVITPTVPEPSSIILFGLGALGMIGYGYRRRKSELSA